MPRYFFDTYDHIVCLDDVGHELPDREAVRRYAYRVLGELMQAERERVSPIELRAVVRNEDSQSILVLTARIEIAETF